ncbi:MAG TPA: insulinase family protein [Holophaga sp.]|nr:insulinase family protein [Holophaga sp.]
MFAAFAQRWVPALLGTVVLALPLRAQLPDVQERVLKNGIRVLILERPGTQAIHGRVFLRGGRSDTGDLPPLAADLLAKGLAAPLPVWNAQVWNQQIERIKQEEAAFESLRLERIQRQRKGGEPSMDVAALEAIRQQVLGDLKQENLRALDEDPMARLGILAPEVETSTDLMTWGRDLPRAAFKIWCEREVAALRHPCLPWFPLDRERMIQGAARSERAPLAILLGTALSGGRYARVLDPQPGALEAISWLDMQAFAKRMVQPERIVIALAGDVAAASAMRELEATFGELAGAAESSVAPEPNTELDEAPGNRRLQANTRDRRLLMAWRIPPLAHADTGRLQVLARVLGSGPRSRLKQRILTEKHLAKRLEVSTGIPGGRDVSLLVIEAEPDGEHPLEELEQAIQSEVLRLQQGLLSDEEIRLAQRQLEVEQAMAQEDAGRLMLQVGTAHCQGGDWRLAFRALSLNKDFTAHEIRETARTYLVPARATAALLEPDALLAEGPQNARVARLLRQVLEPRLEDPARVEAIMRETLRQLRMLPTPDRDRIVKLLEAQIQNQVAP